MDMIAVLVGALLFAVGFLLGRYSCAERAAKKPPKIEGTATERQRLEEAAAMENFFNYDGMPQQNPRDIAADRMVNRK